MNDSAAVAERLHDQRSRDVTPYLTQAREDILEALMRAGCWPEGRNVTVEIDIASYVNDRLVGREADEFIRCLWIGGESADHMKYVHEDLIKAWIPEGLVSEHAETVARQAEEDAEVEADYQRLCAERQS